MNWKPKYRSKCLDCAKEHLYPDCDSGYIGKHVNSRIITTCQHFEQKTCGTCGWHGKHEEKSAGICAITAHPYSYSTNGIYTHDDCKANENSKYVEFDCSWKPIEEPCPTCGGKGKIKEKCKIHKYGPCCCVLDPTIPCPDCQPNEEVLLMPVRWKKKSCEETYILLNNYFNAALGQVYFHNGRYRATAGGVSLRPEENGLGWDDLEQAKAAVEIALEIKKVK